MKEVTAVEWLIQQIKMLGAAVYTPDEAVDILGNKAKAMEKEQIIDAHEEGFYSPPFRMSRRREAEQYFNETYKSE